MAYVSKDAQLFAAIITGRSSAMDSAAGNLMRAAKASAAQHRLTGAYISYLKVIKARGLSGNGRLVDDRLVCADDPGSLSIEFGHFNKTITRTGRRVTTPGGLRFVPGQFIMTRVAGQG